MPYKKNDDPVPGFRMVKLLGRGGFGEVWKAVAPGGVFAALKIINLTSDQGYKEFRAIRLVKHIHHPNLVPTYGFWLKDEEGKLFDDDKSAESINLRGQAAELIIAMGLGDRNLFDRLRECQDQGKPGIPYEELFDYMEAAAKAIDYLNQPIHDLGEGRISIQHCDIKPQNILIVGGSAQVCDFGLARVLGDNPHTQIGGTPFYTPPEVINGNQPSRSTDQYSLAITYYHLLTGQLPFDTKMPTAAMLAHLYGKLDFTKVSEDEQAVLKRATNLEPEQRYASCVELVRELRRAQETANRPRKSVGELLVEIGMEIVPGYRILKPIGKGGYGEVWEASAPGGKHVALKVIRNLECPKGLQEFKSLEVIKSVEHNHLIELHAYWILDKSGEVIPDEMRDRPDAPAAAALVIASRLAHKNLLDRLKECRKQGLPGIPMQELIHYMVQVASAIDHLNAAQHPMGDQLIAIQHRDIKPENILLSRDNTVKLGDFGLAKVLEGSQATIHGTSAGLTPAYAAPELIMGTVTSWSDQYSLAITYYHLRTGSMPFEKGLSFNELVQIHLNGWLELGQLPEAEREIIARATKVQPEERFPDCTTMVRALQKACGLATNWEFEFPKPSSSKEVDLRLTPTPTPRPEQPTPQRLTDKMKTPLAPIEPFVADAPPAPTPTPRLVAQDGGNTLTVPSPKKPSTPDVKPQSETDSELLYQDTRQRDEAMPLPTALPSAPEHDADLGALVPGVKPTTIDLSKADVAPDRPATPILPELEDDFPADSALGAGLPTPPRKPAKAWHEDKPGRQAQEARLEKSRQWLKSKAAQPRTVHFTVIRYTIRAAALAVFLALIVGGWKAAQWFAGTQTAQLERSVDARIADRDYPNALQLIDDSAWYLSGDSKAALSAKVREAWLTEANRHLKAGDVDANLSAASAAGAILDHFADDADAQELHQAAVTNLGAALSGRAASVQFGDPQSPRDLADVFALLKKAAGALGDSESRVRAEVFAAAFAQAKKQRQAGKWNDAGIALAAIKDAAAQADLTIPDAIAGQLDTLRLAWTFLADARPLPNDIRGQDQLLDRWAELRDRTAQLDKAERDEIDALGKELIGKMAPDLERLARTDAAAALRRAQKIVQLDSSRLPVFVALADAQYGTKDYAGCLRTVGEVELKFPGVLRKAEGQGLRSVKLLAQAQRDPRDPQLADDIKQALAQLDCPRCGELALAYGRLAQASGKADKQAEAVAFLDACSADRLGAEAAEVATLVATLRKGLGNYVTPEQQQLRKEIQDLLAKPVVASAEVEKLRPRIEALGNKDDTIARLYEEARVCADVRDKAKRADAKKRLDAMLARPVGRNVPRLGQAYVELAKEQPSYRRDALAKLTEAKKNIPANDRPLLDKHLDALRLDLIGEFVRGDVSSESVKWDDWLGLCQGVTSKNDVVLLAKTECLMQKGATETGLSDDERKQLPVAAKDTKAGAYGHYVYGVYLGTSDALKAADEMLAALAPAADAGPLRAPWRAQHAARILTGAAESVRETREQTKAQLFGIPFKGDDDNQRKQNADRAFQWLTKADGLMRQTKDKATDEQVVDWALAAWFRPEPRPDVIRQLPDIAAKKDDELTVDDFLFRLVRTRAAAGSDAPAAFRGYLTLNDWVPGFQSKFDVQIPPRDVLVNVVAPAISLGEDKLKITRESDKPLRQALARMYAAKGRLIYKDRAAKTITAKPDGTPVSDEEHYKQWLDACEQARALLDEDDPQSARYLVLRDYALMYLAQANATKYPYDSKRFEDDAAKALALNKDLAGGHLLLAFVRYGEGFGYQLAKKYDKAEEALQAAVRECSTAISRLADSTDPSELEQLAPCYQMLGNCGVLLANIPDVPRERKKELLDGAIKDATSAINHLGQRDPLESAECYHLLGHAHEDLAMLVEGNAKGYEQAIRAFKSARRFNPKLARNFIALGRSEYRLLELNRGKTNNALRENEKEAEENLRAVRQDNRVFTSSPSDVEIAEAQYWLSQLRSLQGRQDDQDGLLRAIIAKQTAAGPWYNLALEAAVELDLARAEKVGIAENPKKKLLAAAQQNLDLMPQDNPLTMARLRGTYYRIAGQWVSAYNEFAKVLPNKEKGPRQFAELPIYIEKLKLLLNPRTRGVIDTDLTIDPKDVAAEAEAVASFAKRTRFAPEAFGLAGWARQDLAAKATDKADGDRQHDAALRNLREAFDGAAQDPKAWRWGVEYVKELRNCWERTDNEDKKAQFRKFAEDAVGRARKDKAPAAELARMDEALRQFKK